ncbi:MAG: hydantoinase/oxoprolinase family protein [Alphaproteobacteria bacterium]|nr:hydantoinase/oxoprolinase family protein [Alphaproteobacteria bacterium]
MSVRTQNGSSGPRLHIGIDVGGTFTDLYMLDQSTGATTHHKLASTPRNPHEAPVQGLRELLEKAGASPSNVEMVGLGTTVATNALLERAGALTGMIVTRGFRDLIEIARQSRPSVFDMFVRKPVPLVARENRFEVRERVSWEGDVIEPFSDSEMEDVISRIRSKGIESVAVCFLHSYANPAHEVRAAEMLSAALPNVLVTTSSALLPEFREYERMNTAVMNAYLLPAMQSYLAQFTDAVHSAGIAPEPMVMNSSGGVMRPALAGRRPVDTLFSGPSGGISGAGFLAESAGCDRVITLDMGGTSTEVCVVRDGKPDVSTLRNVDRLPVKGASIDIHTIGSGGSSVAWIDAGGMLRVGPKSVGADPGPACYGRGGALPTLTDANLVLGRLNNQHLLGGRLIVDAARSFEAIKKHIGDPKGISVEAAAAAIVEVSSMDIARAICFVSTERGLDPTDYVLVAFGGAGPLHAAEVAHELGMKGVLVPQGPGVLCAMGVLTKNVELDVSLSRISHSDNEGIAGAVTEIYADLAQRAAEELADSGIDLAQLFFEHSVDARYAGQNFELAVPVNKPDGVNVDVAQMCAGFHEAHRRLYGYAQTEQPVQFVTFRLKAVVPIEMPKIERAGHAGHAGRPEPSEMRRTFFGTVGGYVDCPVFDREKMHVGNAVSGPAIIEQMDTTTVVPPGSQGTIDPLGNLYLAAAQ